MRPTIWGVTEGGVCVDCRWVGELVYGVDGAICRMSLFPRALEPSQESLDFPLERSG
jgi:hypothetical protein